MKPLDLTFHEAGALVEDAPTDSCIALTLPEREPAVLAKLVDLSSYEISVALGSLALFALQEGRRQSRRGGQAS